MSETPPEPERHVRVIDAAAKTEAVHARAAELVQRQATLNDRLDSFFREVAEVRELMQAEGSLWDGPALDPPLEAAFGVWSARGPKETRVTLERVGEAPLMPLEPKPVLRSPNETGYGA